MNWMGFFLGFNASYSMYIPSGLVINQYYKMGNLLKENEERKREVMRMNIDFWAFMLWVNHRPVIQDSVSLFDMQNIDLLYVS